MTNYKHRNPALANIVSGDGQTALERLLAPFARAADLPTRQVIAFVMEGAIISNTLKAGTLGAQLEQRFGGMDRCREVCQQTAFPK